MISLFAKFWGHFLCKLGTHIRLSVTIIILACCFCGCGQNPKIDVTARVENGKLVFDVPHSDINGLLHFRVSNVTGKHLWSITMAYEQGKTITYGELPTGGNNTAQQLVPYDGVSAPPEIWGRPVSVVVGYQYDEFMAASMGDFLKDLNIPEKPNGK